METEIKLPLNKKTKIWLIGVSYDKKAQLPELYQLFFADYQEKDFPLFVNNRIIFFNKTSIEYFMKKNSNIDFHEDIDEMLDLVIFPGKVFDIIYNFDQDNEAFILNYLNIAFDIKALLSNLEVFELNVPLLEKFADYLTFDRNIKAYFDDKQNNRDAVLNELQQLAGFIALHSNIVTSQKEVDELGKLPFFVSP